MINPNTVAKVYRELEHEGVIELRHGAGAFVSGNAGTKKLTDKLRAGQTIVAAAVERLHARGLSDEEIRRLFEAELARPTRTEVTVADALVIETTDLRKSYGSVEALRGLSLQVPAGSIHGFLGPNGAGKTTTIKILLGMARPTSGQARVFGLAPDAREPSVAIRRRTGFVGEDKDLYDYMTVEAMIRFTSPFFPRWRADLEQRYLHRFELPTDRKVKTLSRGMRTKPRCCWRCAAARNY